VAEHIWMEHDQTHHRAQLPDIPYWRANGWNPCDGPPPEPDLTRAPIDEAPPSAGSSAVPDKRAAKSAKSQED
jgi:hypothetical protein